MSNDKTDPVFAAPAPMEKIPGAPKTNPFGGKNPVGLYVPMSEDEQEVIQRLVESDDLELVVHGWTVLDKPVVRHGDLRICIVFRLDFSGPVVPLSFLDLELRMREGLTLFRQKMPTEMNGQPVMVGQGIFLDLAWDIAIDHMDPKVVKLIKPGALGLTSRRLDKDTKERTARGNMSLSEKQVRFLKVIEENAAKIRADDAQKIEEKAKAAPDGVVVKPDDQ